MGVKRLEDLIAFQRAQELKLGIYGLIRQHAAASADFQWKSQLFDAASSVEANIAEGWGRANAREMCQFLRYARASLDETRVRLLDGVARGHYRREECGALLEHERVCGAAIRRLHDSLQKFVRPR